jgi:hypothetical protein
MDAIRQVGADRNTVRKCKARRGEITANIIDQFTGGFDSALLTARFRGNVYSRRFSEYVINY